MAGHAATRSPVTRHLGAGTAAHVAWPAATRSPVARHLGAGTAAHVARPAAMRSPVARHLGAGMAWPAAMRSPLARHLGAGATALAATAAATGTAMRVAAPLLLRVASRLPAVASPTLAALAGPAGAVGLGVAALAAATPPAAWSIGALRAWADEAGGPWPALPCYMALGVALAPLALAGSVTGASMVAVGLGFGAAMAIAAVSAPAAVNDAADAAPGERAGVFAALLGAACGAALGPLAVQLGMGVAGGTAVAHAAGVMTLALLAWAALRAATWCVRGLQNTAYAERFMVAESAVQAQRLAAPAAGAAATVFVDAPALMELVVAARATLDAPSGAERRTAASALNEHMTWLCGPAGCGKTAAAAAVAQSLGGVLFAPRGGDLALDAIAGMPSHAFNLASLVYQASAYGRRVQRPVVVLLDEAEAVLPAPPHASGDERLSALCVRPLLTAIAHAAGQEGRLVLLLAATNYPERALNCMQGLTQVMLPPLSAADLARVLRVQLGRQAAHLAQLGIAAPRLAELPGIDGWAAALVASGRNGRDAVALAEAAGLALAAHGPEPDVGRQHAIAAARLRAAAATWPPAPAAAPCRGTVQPADALFTADGQAPAAHLAQMMALLQESLQQSAAMLSPAEQLRCQIILTRWVTDFKQLVRSAVVDV